MRWLCSESTYAAELGSSGARLLVSTAPFSLQLRLGARVLAQTAAATSYPSAPIACRRAGQWQVVSGPPSVDARGDTLRIEWPDGSSFAVHSDGNLHFAAAGAEAVALALTCRPEEHFYGLGERFDRLDQRGQVLDLWVTNQSSGTATYKPVPFFTSSDGYGLALDTTRRVYCAFGHPAVPDCTTLTVEGPELHATLIAGPHPERIVEAYTGRVGRPPVPPEWMFWPWKSRDWRVEDQASASEDIRRHQELDIPLGVKLIDAGWESDGHSFVFDSSKYPDPAALIREADQAGVRLVLWISPSMTLGGEAYREAAARGFLIRDSSGQPYVHRLGNEPGWIGTSIDFTYSPAVTWWQSQLRRLLDMGVRGFKTDFGEQIPPDAVFSDGRTGAELHNGYPVLYNRVTWEVVREYDGILLGRSGWAGSQAYPAVWAGDQTSDFSPWNGLPTAIVAGQSAGWSGFPYWGSDVGGYFGTPDDEVFVRWTQFAALTPIIESHGLGVREPWLFAPSTLETYRAFAALHARLAPYTQSAASEAFRTGLPIMRAMALSFPELPDIHQDWVQYQYLYGPDLLVAPVYSWGRRRQVLFPPGEWIDFFSGARYAGPSTVEVPARLESLPLFVRAGTLLPLLRDTRTSSASNASNASDASSGQALHLELYPGGSTERLLADGSRLVLDSRPGEAAMRVRVAGPEREYTLSARHPPALRLIHSSAAAVAEGSTLRWRGDAELELVQGV